MAYNICVIGSAFDQNQVGRISRAARETGCSVSFCPDPESAESILKDTHIIFGPSDPRSPAMVK